MPGKLVAPYLRCARLLTPDLTWPQVAAQMKEVYEWVLGGGPKPGSVRQF
jgi:hypothetical protein